MSNLVIERGPGRAGVIRLLEAAELPTSDLTDAHMADFFYCGSSRRARRPRRPGVSRGRCARSFAGRSRRTKGALGWVSALVEKAESYARARGARSHFSSDHHRRKFLQAAAATRRPISAAAPDAIRTSREFADLCPASAAFLVKHLL